MERSSIPAWATPPDTPPDARTVLLQLYWAALQAVAPGPALRAALERLPPEIARRRVWIFAIGKAAHPMATAAVEYLEAAGNEPAGGMIVSPRHAPSPHGRLDVYVGDHPQPGPQSLAAARAIEAMSSKLRAGEEAWVLLSGGASSLICAPDGAIRAEDVTELFRVLHASGLDIATMNLIRKRFTRWGAGRLAVALKAAHIRNFIISDVIGDDFAAIGSGPCVPDPSTASQIRSILVAHKLWDRIPPIMHRHIHAVERDPSLETPKAGDEAFENIERRIIASNRTALDAIVARAKELRLRPAHHEHDARRRSVARRPPRRLVARQHLLLRDARPSPSAPSAPASSGGARPPSRSRADSHGVGGRCQELALSAARELALLKSARGSTMLACGTDGRDGNSDAAGADRGPHHVGGDPQERPRSRARPRGARVEPRARRRRRGAAHRSHRHQRDGRRDRRSAARRRRRC